MFTIKNLLIIILSFLFYFLSFFSRYFCSDESKRPGRGFMARASFKVYIVGLLTLCFLFVACGTTGKVLKSTYCASVYGCPGKYEIKEPYERINNVCLSVLPPQEEGWSIVRKKEWWIKKCDAIAIGTEDMNTLETTIISVVPFKLDEIETTEDFISEMNKRYDDINDVDRYDEVYLFEEEIFKAKETTCTMHYFLVKDVGIPEQYKKEFMYLETIDINCPIPWKALFGGDMGVRFSYSRRYNPGDEDPDFKEKALEFFEQIQFLD